MQQPVNRLFLTVQGQQLLAEVLPVHRKVLASLFASLSSEDLGRLPERENRV